MILLYVRLGNLIAFSLFGYERSLSGYHFCSSSLNCLKYIFVLVTI